MEEILHQLIENLSVYPIIYKVLTSQVVRQISSIQQYVESIMGKTWSNFIPHM